LEEDKKSKYPFAVTQADEQGPHEAIIRAGEERVLAWAPEVPAPGRYTVCARLVYDLNRYNDRAFQDDQFEMAQVTLEFTIPTSQKKSRIKMLGCGSRAKWHILSEGAGLDFIDFGWQVS
jgi:hypothetical protein